MRRNIDLNEISDGKKYYADSMVKIGCNDCAGCHKCCSGMSDTIILDPYDICIMSRATGLGFEELLRDKLELNVVDGIILPNIKMEPQCGFLSKEGRCSIHANRPGICRLFPLGRVYEDDSFYYINQVGECDYPSKYKVKLNQWLGYDNIREYEAFIQDWHGFIKEMEAYVMADEEKSKAVCMLILNAFYVTVYDGNESFNEEYQRRKNAVRKALLVV